MMDFYILSITRYIICSVYICARVNVVKMTPLVASGQRRIKLYLKHVRTIEVITKAPCVTLSLWQKPLCLSIENHIHSGDASTLTNRASPQTHTHTHTHTHTSTHTHTHIYTHTYDVATFKYPL